MKGKQKDYHVVICLNRIKTSYMGPYKGDPLYGISRKINTLYAINKKLFFLYAIYYRLLNILYAINTFIICHKEENKEDYMP